MKFDVALIALTLASSVSAGAIADTQPQSHHVERVARDSSDSHNSEEHDLWKRKGGGGRGGRGSGGGNRGSGGGNRGSGSSAPLVPSFLTTTTTSHHQSQPRWSGGVGTFMAFNTMNLMNMKSSPKSSPKRTTDKPDSRTGGGSFRTVSGSGPQPRFGGGRFYPGGARAPYQAGSRTPIAGLAAVGLVGVAALAFWPGSWYRPNVHAYRYNNEYSFYNATADQNQTKPVLCGCEDEAPCGCDEPEDRSERDDWLDEVIGNGSYPHLNKSIVDVGDYEGRSTILINGTLPQDTTLADPDADSAADGMRIVLEQLGWWPAAAAAMAAVLVA